MSESSKVNKKSKLKIKSWYSNRYQIVLIQRNVLLLFTLVSMFSVAVAVIFVKTIMSSKSLEPYVIEVEQKSGVATVVDQMTSQTFTGDQVIRRYFINEFIQSAFAYEPSAENKKNFDKVRVFSSQPVFVNYRNRLKEYGADSFVSVRIKTILFTESNAAQVRVVQQVKKSQDSVAVNKDYLINLNFYFAPENNLSMEDRLINPLGFQISKINIAEEVFNY